MPWPHFGNWQRNGLIEKMLDTIKNISKVDTAPVAAWTERIAIKRISHPLRWLFSLEKLCEIALPQAI